MGNSNTFVKDPRDVKDYQINWATWLTGVSDIIETVSWTIPAGITKESDTFTSTTATIWLSGGTAGTQYELVCHIHTVGDRDEEDSLFIIISDTATTRAAYSLEAARAALLGAFPYLSRGVSLAPLNGLFDGTNKIFTLPVVPIAEEADLSLYDVSGTAVTLPAVLDTTHGTLRFATAPTEPVYATYTAQALSDVQLLNICQAGFDEMQARYRRDYYLVAQGGRTYLSANAASVVDPACGSRTFSTSRIQIAFFGACCALALAKAMLFESAALSVQYREERVGGLLVDRSKQAAYWQAILDRAMTDIEEKRQAAAEELGDTESFGQFIEGAKSDNYVALYSWWEDSDQARGV